MKLSEIDVISLPKESSFERFYSFFLNYKIFPKKFKNFIVIRQNSDYYDTYVVLDETKFIEPTKERPIMHYFEKIKKVIPKESIVLGMDLADSTMPKYNQKTHICKYIAINPAYQGKGLATDFYIWLLDYANLTGVGILQSDEDHTLGSVRIWQTLAKKCLVLAYSVRRKKYSVVDIDDDGELEADFPIYKDKDLAKELWTDFNQEKAELFHSYEILKKITASEYEKQLEILSNKFNKELSDAGVGNTTILYATKKYQKKN